MMTMMMMTIMRMMMMIMTIRMTMMTIMIMMMTMTMIMIKTKTMTMIMMMMTTMILMMLMMATVIMKMTVMTMMLILMVMMTMLELTPTRSTHRWLETVQEERTLWAFHGSRLDNFYSILHYGLQQHLNKTGLFGEGIYLCQDLGVCLTYSSQGLAWRNSSLGEAVSCVVVC